jgi:hypothetical protein
VGRLDFVSSGAGCVAARRRVMRQVSWRFQGHFRDRREIRPNLPPADGRLRPKPRRKTPEENENIVMPAVDRYIAGANPPAGLDPAALRRTPRIIGNCCRPRRVAAPGDADRTNRAGVFADATPTEEFRDVMFPNAPGLRVSSLFPHNTASPAGRSAAALAARLGVLPQCQSACLSTPPIPRKLV